MEERNEQRKSKERRNTLSPDDISLEDEYYNYLASSEDEATSEEYFFSDGGTYLGQTITPRFAREETGYKIASERYKETEEILKELREERKEAERKEEFLEDPKKPPRIEIQPDKTKQGKKEIKTPSKIEEEPTRPTTLYPEVIIINRLDEQLDSPEAKESDKKTKKRKDKELAQTDGKTDDSSEDESRDTEKDKHDGKRRKIHFLKDTPGKVALGKNNPETQGKMIGANSIIENRTLPIIMGGTDFREGKLETEIGKICKNGYEVKFINNNTHIYIKNSQELGKVKDYLTQNEVGFFASPQKPKGEEAYVLKGLDDIREEKEIIKALKEEHNLIVTKYTR
ncbi:hypothetical protein JTB14_037877 [Gonioctena quinquepunctata]|nr:hypothetical protein JTB14_037877 [Gonioctena quinquepunctata]